MAAAWGIVDDIQKYSKMQHIWLHGGAPRELPSRVIFSKLPSRYVTLRLTVFEMLSVKWEKSVFQRPEAKNGPPKARVVVLVLVLVLKESLRTNLKSWSWSWSLELKFLSLSWSLTLRSWSWSLRKSPWLCPCLVLSIFFVAFTKSLSAKPASKHTLHVRFYLLDIGRNCLW